MNSETVSITEAVILAGGLGTRLQSVVKDVPKPMAPVRGRPFLEYQFEYLIEQGIERVILSVGYLWRKIEKRFGSHYKTLAIEYAVEEQPLGTGGGLLKAVELCHGEQPLLVMNGDTWFPILVNDLYTTHSQHQADVTIAIRKDDAARRYAGIVIDANNRVVNYFSAGEEGDHWINGGVYLISNATLRNWNAYSGRNLSLEKHLLEEGIEAGLSCYAYPGDSTFIDIGIPEDYARAEMVIHKNSY